LPSKSGKKVFDRWHSQNVTKDWNFLHRLRRNGEELAKQIHQSIELTQHTHNGPPKHDQDNATKEGNNPTDSVFSGKETKRSGWTYNGQG
jgi:hypothetical protein